MGNSPLTPQLTPLESVSTAEQLYGFPLGTPDIFICLFRVCHGTCVDDRGQPTRVVFLLLPLGPGDQTQVVRLSGRHLYRLNHLARPLT